MLDKINVLLSYMYVHTLNADADDLADVSDCDTSGSVCIDE